MWTSGLLAAGAGLVLGLWPAVGAAQTCTAKDAADQLFRQARMLVESREHESACSRLEASMRLDPALGTMLNLAVCHEGLGHWERALALYRSVEKLAAEDKDDQRVRFARQSASKLKSQMPRLVLRVDGERPDGFVVSRNCQPVADEQLERSLPVDEGTHVIVATAPGHRPFVAHVVIQRKAGETQVTVAMEPIVDVSVTSSVEDASTDRKIRTLGLVLTGVGGAATTAGLISGGLAWRTWERAFADGWCNEATRACSEAGQERVRAAHTHANVSTGLVGAGLVVVGAGVALYLLAPKMRRMRGILAAPDLGAERTGFTFLVAF